MSKNSDVKQADKIVRQTIAVIDTNDHSVKRRGDRRRVTTRFTQPSMTKQADLDRANIHTILDRFKKTGHIPQVTAQPLEGAYPETDFMEAQNLVAAVNSQFEQLPVKIRERFNNRPEQLLQFASDPENAPELVRLGLAKAPEQPEGQGGEPDPAPSTQRAQNAGEGEGAAPAGGENNQ